MQRKFLTNLGLILLLNLLIKPVFIFGIDRNVQNIVGEVDYGFYFVIFNFSFLFQIILDLGITNFNNRNIAQNSHLLNKHFSGILVMKIMLAAVYIVITFIIAFIMNYNAAQLKLLGILAFNQILVSFILYLRSNISGIFSFKTDSFLSILDRFLMILFCGVLLFGHVTKTPFRIEWFVYSQTIAYLLTAFIAFFIVLKKAQFRKLTWNYAFFLMIIKQSYPFALLVLLMSFYNRLDPIMLEKLLPDTIGNKQVGIYAKSFRLLDAANMIGYLFAVLLVPIFSRMLKNRQSIEYMLKLAFTILITIALIVSIGCIFYSYELMDLLYKVHITEASNVFKVLMGGFIAVSTTYIFGTLLTANGNLKELNIISLCSLLINFCINLFLIPRMYAEGSAYASLVTQFFTAIVQIIIVQRVFKFRINYKYLLTLAFFIIGVVFLNFVSKQVPIHLTSTFGGFSWKINFILAIILSFLLAAVLKLLNIKSLLRILRNDQ
ncbi:MAG: oligosaccharide flippase family protein [Bacteroidetes bacterium]|nr:oligosaccharide flippase family protein [Bacteroidota bacterium]